MKIVPIRPSTARERVSPSHSSDLFDLIAQACRKTQAYYVAEQQPDGYWWYELESNVTITAEYLMLFHFVGIKDEERDRRIARYILRHQRDDGTWAIHYGGKGDLSTTVEAYFALKLAGFSAEDPALKKARQFILAQGGVERSRVFTKVFLALFGQMGWQAVPSVPVEIMLLPHWAPLNIYNMSAWARGTVVPLSILLHLRPVKPLPEHVAIRELYKNPFDRRPSLTTGPTPFLSWKRFFVILDKLIKAVEATGLRPFRKRALQMAKTWVLEHQEERGDWLGIQPAIVNSMLALVSLGYGAVDGPAHGPVQKGFEALKRFTIETEDELLLQSCVSPVWDTALTALALLHSGVDEDRSSLTKACRWLSSKQILRKGDWSVKRPNLEPGGWSFEFENDWQPDVDDTAVVMMFLNRYRKSGLVSTEKLEWGLRWVLGMQGKDGGWSAFDADNNKEIANQIPFADLQAMLDPSTPDVTGRALELLGMFGYGPNDAEVQQALAFLKKTQEEDGLWWGRWGVNYGYGTWSVLEGLRSIGEEMDAPYVRKAVATLKRHQNEDGGWGECCESYEDPRLRLQGKSTPSQTAWVIMALLAAGEEACEEVTRGISFLLERQKPDGTWDEPEFTATGFPRYFMINYHNYRNCFPLMALGKFISRFTVEEDGP
ncbi:MAG TPA: squalene--hopene cyclase [Syntrophorhabdales bacterium]|nr:squalene--hopene cyclase [Syntrophorhabdales bacterium]